MSATAATSSSSTTAAATATAGEQLDSLESPIADASTVLTSRNGEETRVTATSSLLSKRPNFAAYKCDVCDKYPIRGYRWECSDCEDFDMCNACQKQKKGNHSKNHVLVRFKVAPAAKTTKWRPSETQKEGPALSQRTLSRMQSTEGSKSAAALRSEVTRLKIPLPVKKVGSRKGELAMRLFETGVDTYEATTEILELEDGVPLSVERLFMMNALVQADLVRVSTLDALEDPADKRPSPPFKAAEVASVLCGMVGQFVHRDKHQFAWFSEPVSKDVPRYHEVVKEPMDLGTLLKSLESRVKRPSALEAQGPHALFAEVLHGLNLVWENATLFNPAQHPVHEEALRFRWMLSVVLVNACILWPALFDKYCGPGTSFPVKHVSYDDVKPKPVPRLISSSSSFTGSLAPDSTPLPAPPALGKPAAPAAPKSLDRPTLERVTSVGSTSASVGMKRLASPHTVQRTPDSVKREPSRTSQESASDVGPREPKSARAAASIIARQKRVLRSMRDEVKFLHERIDHVEAVLRPFTVSSDAA
ncbi:Bromodomain-containing protein bet-1 [Hondaea fermentalgiana]|uniref:Bromodomain-containing protein bet-1 n=1 Tax=Hondaea fermentalgiana TaxID=2315210 RepID=A0A2R5G505_9STRA|nr:Bromodomain-containing protein bet-1 [Hondaea fermentalgiana]|eukprot:GBG26112.1 Bromodomain-containing protein bet-1 [Hondaea fermentalgiana]